MLHPGIKRLAVFSILLCIFLIHAGYTSADIFAERIMKMNKMTAISIDFSSGNSINNGTLLNLFHSTGMLPGGFDLGAIRIQTKVKNMFRYHLRVKKINGDDVLCQHLNVKVLDRNFFAIYTGPLLELSMSSSFTNVDPRDYIFFVSLDETDAVLQNKICEFDFEWKTYRSTPDESGGIYAERKVRNSISSGTW